MKPRTEPVFCGLRVVGNAALVRARILLRGMHHTERPTEALDPALRRRQECLWAATYCLYGYRPLLALELHARFLLLSLELGEPGRLAQALGFEALMRMILTPGRPDIYSRLLAQAEQLAERSQQPYIQALVALLAIGFVVLRPQVDATIAGTVPWRSSPSSRHGRQVANS